MYVGNRDLSNRTYYAAQTANELVQQGVPPDQARAQAAAQYGQGVSAETVARQQSLGVVSREPQHYGSTVDPSSVRYYKDDKGILTYRAGTAAPPEGFKQIDYQTFKTIERAKSGQPLGVKELERIAPSNTAEFKQARQELARQAASKPTMPSDIFYSLRQRQAEQAQRQREVDVLRAGGQVGDVRFSQQAYRRAVDVLGGNKDVAPIQNEELPYRLVNIKPVEKVEKAPESLRVEILKPRIVENLGAPMPKEEKIPPYQEEAKKKISQSIFLSYIPASLKKGVKSFLFPENVGTGNMAGYYKWTPQTITSYAGLDIGVMAHELAHHMNKVQGVSLGESKSHGPKFQEALKITTAAIANYPDRPKSRVELFSAKAQTQLGISQFGNTLTVAQPGVTKQYTVEGKYEQPIIAKESASIISQPIILKGKGLQQKTFDLNASKVRNESTGNKQPAGTVGLFSKFSFNNLLLPQEKRVEKIEALADRITRVEQARQNLGIDKGVENIRNFSNFITGGNKFLSGAVTFATGWPFIIAQQASQVPSALLKTSALAAGLITPSTRESTLTESSRAFKVAKEEVKQTVKSPEFWGAVVGGGVIGTVSATAKSPIKTFTTDIKGTKTTFIKSPVEAGWKSPSGKRAVILTKGETNPTIDVIYPVAKPKTPSVGIFSENILRDVPPSQSPAYYRQKAYEADYGIGKEKIKYPKTEPVGIFAKEQPPYQSPAYYKQKAREATVPISQSVSSILSGRDTLTANVPSKVRRGVRQQIVAKNSINPLDTSPKGIFAKELPLNQPPSYYAQSAKEGKILRVEQGVKLSRVFFPSNFAQIVKQKKLTYPTRLLTVGKTSIAETQGWTQTFQKNYARYIASRIKSSQGKPVIEIISTKPKAPIGYKYIERKITDFQGRTQVQLQLVKLKPQKLRPTLLQEQIVKPKLKSEQVSISVQKQKLASKQKLRQEQASETKQTLSPLLGTESIKKSRLSLALGIVPKLASAQTIAQQQSQKQRSAQISLLSSVQSVGQTEQQSLLSLQAENTMSAKASLLSLGSAQASETRQEKIQKKELRQEQVLKQTFPRPKLPSEEQPKISSIFAEKAEKGYIAYVKRKQLKTGKGSYKSRGYEQLNKEPMTRAQALNRLMQTVDQYTNRSGYIKQQGTAKPSTEQLSQSLMQKFRQTGNKIVEKSTYAIDSMEEKQGIPFEAQRQRKAGFFKTKSTIQTAIARTRKELASLVSAARPKQSVRPRDSYQRVALLLARKKNQLIYGSSSSAAFRSTIKPKDLDIATSKPMRSAKQLQLELLKRKVQAKIKKKYIPQLKRNIYEVGSVSYSQIDRSKIKSSILTGRVRQSSLSKEVSALSSTISDTKKYYRHQKDLLKLRRLKQAVEKKQQAKYMELVNRLSKQGKNPFLNVINTPTTKAKKIKFI